MGPTHTFGRCGIYTFVLVLLAAIVGYLVYTIFRLRDNDYSYLANRMAKKTRESFEVLKPCPICHAMLRRGERLHTVVYTGGRKRAAGDADTDAVRDDVDPDATTTASDGAGRPASSPGAGTGASTGKPRSGGRNRPDDALTHIFGCPYCYPPNDEHPRYCPVCERKLGPEDYVIARMFTRAPRSHVHVLGCTLCRGPGSRARRM